MAKNSNKSNPGKKIQALTTPKPPKKGVGKAGTDLAKNVK